MPIDFSKFKTNETITPEVLASSDLVNFINVAMDADKSKISSELDSSKTAKALLEEKLESLSQQMADLKKSAPDDAEAVKALKNQMASMKIEIESQFREQIKTLNSNLEAEKSNNLSLQQDLDTAEVRTYLRNQIADYNLKHPTVAIVDGADDHLISAGLKTFKKTDIGIRALSGKTELYGIDGKNLEGVEYFSKLREEPSMALFFNRPTGGGANGGNGGGAGENWDQYYDPKTINLTKQAELSRVNPGLHRQLSEKKR